MISFGVYRFLHFLGIFLVLTGLGGAVMRAMLSPAAASAPAGDGAASDGRLKRFQGMTHGIGMLFILIGGFGMLARLDLGFPGWVVGKLLVWMALGAMLGLSMRLARHARVLWFAIPLLAVLAWWLAYTKPF